MSKKAPTKPEKQPPKPKYSKVFLAQLKGVTAKRARTVIDHILKHGFITTEELATEYGYDHAPRAARDVRELGIKLETFKVKSKEGRSIAAYRFDKSCLEGSITVSTGRIAFPKAFKLELIGHYGSKCNICSGSFDPSILQVDHRVPYEVAGDADSDTRKVAEFQLLCGSCNRAKSCSCEHCANWLKEKKADLCRTCYWGRPEEYKHIAMEPIRRLDIAWTKDEVEAFDRLRVQAVHAKEPMPDYVKKILDDHTRADN